MHMTAFAPVGGALLKAGSPAISAALQLAAGEIPLAGAHAGPRVGMTAPRVIYMIAGQLGVNDPDAAPEAVAAKVTDTISADPAAAQAKLASLESEHTFALGMRDKDNADAGQQVGLLTLDAASTSWLARSWRPLTAIGLALFLGFQLMLPYVVWAAQWAGGHPPALPEPRFDVTVAVLSGLLGLGVMRTADKIGVAQALKPRK